MLLLAWKLENKPVLLVGAGEVATTRVVKLLDAKCNLHLVAPWANEEVKKLASEGKLTLTTRKFEWSDLEAKAWAMVLTAIDDRQLSIDIAGKCQKMRLPVNAADIPDSCDFYFGANVNKGPLKMLISTQGAAPAIAKKIRQTIEETLDTDTLIKAIDNISSMKKQIREKFPEMDAESVKLRMGFVIEYCDTHSWEELASLTAGEVKGLVTAMEITAKLTKSKLEDQGEKKSDTSS